MIISGSRFILKDFGEPDRAAFVAYQSDPRYRALYDYPEAQLDRANDLFAMFLEWQTDRPRRNYQFGIFEVQSGRLCGSAGLRIRRDADRTAVFGIELSPDNWGRYRMALEVAETLIDFGFDALELETIVGDTASGNRRVERLADWFGARLTAERIGPDWMTKRGWREVDWTLSRSDWREVRRRQADFPRCRRSALGRRLHGPS